MKKVMIVASVLLTLMNCGSDPQANNNPLGVKENPDGVFQIHITYGSIVEVKKEGSDTDTLHTNGIFPVDLYIRDTNDQKLYIDHTFIENLDEATQVNDNWK